MLTSTQSGRHHVIDFTTDTTNHPLQRKIEKDVWLDVGSLPTSTKIAPHLDAIAPFLHVTHPSQPHIPLPTIGAPPSTTLRPSFRPLLDDPSQFPQSRPLAAQPPSSYTQTHTTTTQPPKSLRILSTREYDYLHDDTAGTRRRRRVTTMDENQSPLSTTMTTLHAARTPPPRAPPSLIEANESSSFGFITPGPAGKARAQMPSLLPPHQLGRDERASIHQMTLIATKPDAGGGGGLSMLREAYADNEKQTPPPPPLVTPGAVMPPPSAWLSVDKDVETEEDGIETPATVAKRKKEATLLKSLVSQLRHVQLDTERLLDEEEEEEGEREERDEVEEETETEEERESEGAASLAVSRAASPVVAPPSPPPSRPKPVEQRRVQIQSLFTKLKAFADDTDRLLIRDDL